MIPDLSPQMKILILSHLKRIPAFHPVDYSWHFTPKKILDFIECSLLPAHRWRISDIFALRRTPTPPPKNGFLASNSEEIPSVSKLKMIPGLSPSRKFQDSWPPL
jgi:hypothetical protein